MRLRSGLLIAFACLAPASAWAAGRPDAIMNDYFAVWSDNGRITPGIVASLYGRRVLYYGRALDPAGVYRDKMALVRRLPYRRYSVAPGTLVKSCDAGKTRCTVRLVLDWQVAGAGQRHAGHGRSTVSLVLAREDGALKIVRESGAALR